MGPPPLVSWNAPLRLLHPCWLSKFSHSHPQPHPGLVITGLPLRTPHTPSSHSLATHPVFPVLSLPPSPRLFALQGRLPWVLPSTTARHLRCSALSFLTLFLHPTHLGLRPRGLLERCPQDGAAESDPTPHLRLAVLPKPLGGPLPPDSIPSLSSHFLEPHSATPPPSSRWLHLLPHGRRGGPQRRTPQLSAASSSSRTFLILSSSPWSQKKTRPSLSESPPSIWIPNPLSSHVSLGSCQQWFVLLPNHFLSAGSAYSDVKTYSSSYMT